MFVPDDNSRTRQMRMDPFGVRLVAGLVVLAIALAGMGVATYWKVASVALETSRIKNENDRLTLEVQKVWELERLMGDMLETDYKIRKRLGIDFPEDWPGYNYQLVPEGTSETADADRGAPDQAGQTGSLSGETDDTTPFFVWPVAQGWPTMQFGESGGTGGSHTGIDVAAQTGTPIRAVADGRVVYADMDDQFGNLVEIDHGNRLSTRYGHCSRMVVRTEQIVMKGDIIAYVGSTGRVTTGPHLHFEVSKNGRFVDPNTYLPRY